MSEPSSYLEQLRTEFARAALRQAEWVRLHGDGQPLARAALVDSAKLARRLFAALSVAERRLGRPFVDGDEARAHLGPRATELMDTSEDAWARATRIVATAPPGKAR